MKTNYWTCKYCDHKKEYIDGHEFDIYHCNHKDNSGKQCNFDDDYDVYDCAYLKSQEITLTLLDDLGFKLYHEPEPRQIYSYNDIFWVHMYPVKNKDNNKIADITMTRSEFLKRFISVIEKSKD